MDIKLDQLDDFIDAALKEDIGSGDITSEITIPSSSMLSAHAVAREDMVIAGLPVAERIFKKVDPAIHIHLLESDGSMISKGTKLMKVSGRARSILTAERTALNLLQLLSGMATLTRQYVDAVSGTKAKILDTRKTIPGLRLLSKYATRMGGAVNHRIGLYDGILVKDNHLANISITEAVTKLKMASPLPVQIECDTPEQVDEAIAAGAPKILLDNMSPVMMKTIVEKHKNNATFEASGGVRLDTVRAIAESGVDFISIGRLTHSAPAVDIGLDF